LCLEKMDGIVTYIHMNKPVINCNTSIKLLCDERMLCDSVRYLIRIRLSVA
jgi:hypothetical protein